MLSKKQVFKALFVENFEEKIVEYKMSHNNEKIKILMINFW